MSDDDRPELDAVEPPRNRRAWLVAAGLICRFCGCDLTEQETGCCSVCYRREYPSEP